jgi:hypothetical protein
MGSVAAGREAKRYGRPSPMSRRARRLSRDVIFLLFKWYWHLDNENI